MPDTPTMDSIADVKLIIEASDRRGVVRRATFSATAATDTSSGFSMANEMARNLRYEAENQLQRAQDGRPSKFDEPPTASLREDEPEPRDVTMTNEPPEGFTGVLRFTTPGEPEPELHTGLFIERGRWYPDMPPGLPGETDEQYTNRLTGYSGRALIPYDHRRYRECSIGFHDTCSQRATPAAERNCECPCHTDADTISAAAQRLGAAGHQVGDDDEPAPATGVELDGTTAALVAAAAN